MTDQNSQFFAILTNIGVAKQANADALGIAWKITQMGVGDANGTDPQPDAKQKTLIREWRRAPLNELKQDPSNPAIIIAEQVIPAEIGGNWIREIGLYDADGDLVAVANCAPSYKPTLAQGSGRTQVVRMNLIVSNSANVELKIDPSVVLATRAFVEQRLADEIARLDSKQSVRVATTGPIALSGLPVLEGAQLVAGDRVLVKNQANGRENGIWIAAAGVWSRATDADASAEVTPNLLVSVEEGATLADTLWQLTTNAPVVLGSTALVFERVAGPNGVIPGTYRQVTVDIRGLVVAGSNPTTLGGYGIGDAYTKTEIDAKNALLQPKLGFTAVQQGTGAGQQANTVRIGWSGTVLKAAIDNTDLGNLWYAGNFDPNSKANWGSTLAAYGITNAYTKAETDAQVATRLVRDWISAAGFQANDPTLPYMRRESDSQIFFLQPRLGFTPVQNGGGIGQNNNPIKMGYSPSGVKVTVDATDMGNLWYSGNFDPNSKANWGTTLAAYGITNAYTKAESDARDTQRALSDAITHVGFAADNVALPYLRRTSDGQVYYLQPRLGYTPIEQGGGAGMGANKVRLGYNAAGSLRLQVDATDMGDLISDQNLGPKIGGLGLNGVGSYAFATVITSQGQVNQGGLVAGTNLRYSSTNSGDGAANTSGSIGVGTWRVHGAFTNFERTLFQRVS
ncbi:phage tail protein [Pseudomonas sp. W5-36]|uniref:phage tail protein n=1 Tax=Pseudomonas sp. W5-36 TaxID=3097455 RepID=UPI003979F81D